MKNINIIQLKSIVRTNKIFRFMSIGLSISICFKLYSINFTTNLSTYLLIYLFACIICAIISHFEVSKYQLKLDKISLE